MKWYSQRSGSWITLGIAGILAALTIMFWTSASLWGETIQFRHIQPGGDGTHDGVTYQLTSLHVAESLGGRPPMDGALFVIADVSYSAAAADPERICDFYLLGDETTDRNWKAHADYALPEFGLNGSCTQASGVFNAVYLIPANSLAEIRGLLLLDNINRGIVLLGKPVS